MDEYVGVGASLQTEGIAVGNWIVIRVGIKIISTTEADRVFAQESPLRGIVITSSIIVQPGFRIKLAGCVTE